MGEKKVQEIGVPAGALKPLPSGPQMMTTSPGCSRARRLVPRPTTWMRKVTLSASTREMEKGRPQGSSRPQCLARSMANWPGR